MGYDPCILHVVSSSFMKQNCLMGETGMNFHQLHTFYAVVEKGSFSAAAQALRMSQPAVTMQIQALEEHFGAKLFHRSTKKIRLTEAGATLLPYAVRSVELMRETDQAMARFTKMLSERMTLGASLTFGEYILPRLLGPFSKEYPNITVHLKVMNTTQILEEILNHQLTFGLVEASVEHPDIHAEAVLSDELKLILPKDHPLTLRERITIDDVIPYPFVLREKGSGTRQVMEEELRRKNIDLNQLIIMTELGSTGAVKSAVEAGLGISILSQSSVKHEEALGLLVVRSIESFDFRRHFYSIYSKTSILPGSAVTFLTFLQNRDLSKWL